MRDVGVDGVGGGCCGEKSGYLLEILLKSSALELLSARGL